MAEPPAEKMSKMIYCKKENKSVPDYLAVACLECEKCDLTEEDGCFERIPTPPPTAEELEQEKFLTSGERKSS